MVRLVPNLEQNVLEHIVRVAFFMHNVAYNRFQSSAMPRIKFIQRLGPMFRDCFHERFVGNGRAICHLQSWVQHMCLRFIGLFRKAHDQK